MKLTKIVIASTLSAFAFISTAALAETFNFGEGQSSIRIRRRFAPHAAVQA
ncbi:hypothetical protein [Caballeronia sp. 15711]|uniref:hypothetical protein n=1 Tax=Caballeronia sp. 15711 TaxID=3391029 RepID=UPI0039E72486